MMLTENMVKPSSWVETEIKISKVRQLYLFKFTDKLQQRLDELFDKNNNKQRVIITIARDPIDSISSYLAIHHGVADIFLTIQRITDYVLMYAFLCENADYVIDFNDLVTYPEPVVKKILSLLNIDKNEYSLFNRGHISKFKNYVPSSKSLKNYDNSLLDNLDTDLCYFYYNKLLEKKIIL